MSTSKQSEILQKNGSGEWTLPIELNGTKPMGILKIEFTLMCSMMTTNYTSTLNNSNFL